MFIYVYQRGEDHEGSTVIDIYSNEDSATRALASCFNRRRDEFNEWMVDKEEEDHEEMKPTWQSEYYSDGLRFHSGCDYWEVVQVRVKD